MCLEWNEKFYGVLFFFLLKIITIVHEQVLVFFIIIAFIFGHNIITFFYYRFLHYFQNITLIPYTPTTNAYWIKI